MIRMQTWPATMEKKYGESSKKIKIETIQSNSTPSGDIYIYKHIHKGNEITIVMMYLYSHVHWCVIHNSQTSSKCLSASQWMDKVKVTYICLAAAAAHTQGILSTLRKRRKSCHLW